MPLIKFWFIQSKPAEYKAFPLPRRRRLLQWYMPSPENITFTSNEWAQYGCTKERKNVKIKADNKSVSFSVLFKARGTFSEQRQRFCFEAPPNNFPTKIKYYYLTRYLQYCYVHLSYNWCLGSGKLWGRLLAAKIPRNGRGWRRERGATQAESEVKNCVEWWYNKMTRQLQPWYREERVMTGSVLIHFGDSSLKIFCIRFLLSIHQRCRRTWIALSRFRVR